MNFKWCMLFLVIVCVQVTLSLASQKRKKNEEETKENSINYYYNELLHRPGHLFTSMLHDATLPVFLVMGVASLASVLTNGKNEGQNGVHGRSKRSSPSHAWTQNILKVLGNVQKAIEKYQHLEDEIINDLDESVKREFESKSSD